tara:strand:+ start:6378 stop:7493 length:1116 start_codon:yes stop_codon:yes gene_type:complete
MIDFELDIDIESILLKENIDNSFRDVFDIQNFSVNINKNETESLDTIFEQEFAPKKEMSFDVVVDIKSTLHNSDFRSHFGIHNFETCLDENKNINDIIFEEHFKEEQKYDYNIIDKLKKNLNSRKILTREEREQIPENEPEVFSIEEDKKEVVSIEEGLKKSESVIKENSFYRIVEFDESDLTQLPTKVDTSYKEEVDQKIADLENKYEDLLQKTKDDYESRLEKMLGDFSNFRNQVNQQVNRMAFISSSTGGGAVNILDMDDLDKTNLQDGYSLSYNSDLRKFEFVDIVSKTLDHLQSEIYIITQDDIDRGYLELNIPSDPEYYNISELHINGLVNTYPEEYDFISPTQVNISNLLVDPEDKVKIIYVKF